MTRRLACFLLPLCLFGSAVNGQDAGNPEPTPASVLVEQLGSRDFRIREEASKSLIAQGAGVLPALRKALGHPDFEVRRRAEQIITQVQDAAALAPKQVSLHLRQRPAKEALAELARQTGYQVVLLQDSPERDKEVFNFDFDRVPFWEGLHRVSEASGIVLQQNYYGDDVIRLAGSAQPQYVPFISLHGPFFVVAQGFSYGRSLQFGVLNRDRVPVQQRASEFLNLTLHIAAEPRLPLLRVGQVRLQTAEDEDKNSLVPRQGPQGPYTPRSYYDAGGYRCCGQQFQINLARPSPSSRLVRTLKGTLPVTLLAEQRPSITVDNLSAAKGKRFQGDGIELDFEDMSEAPKEAALGAPKAFQLKLSIRDTRPENPGDFSWAHGLAQRLELLDARGNKYVSRGYNWAETTANQVKGASLLFAAGPVGGQAIGPPAKLVYYTWVKREHEVPFEFRDLPLP
jgi:hypothetical protein